MAGTYTLDDWQPDGIAVVFPACTLVIVESFESEMELEFSEEDTGVEYSLSLTHALRPHRVPRGNGASGRRCRTATFEPGAS